MRGFKIACAGDKIAFSKLISDMKGNRSYKELQNLTGIKAERINKYANQQADEPMSREEILKLVRVSVVNVDAYYALKISGVIRKEEMEY